MNKELEEVREELYEFISNCTCLSSEDVIEISERLDKLIIEEYESIYF
ncbi:Spo0E family sporulation regulatory protein-aspartic acid phosphatase [Clostridium sp.]